MSTPPDLSLCLIVRDEAARLPACLASAVGLDAELVVVDTGSRDGTPDIARSAGARLREIAWPGDFAAARNASLELATGRWILVLDADETLPPASVAAIRALVAGPADRAYSLVQRNALADGAGHVAVRVVRLFPNRPDLRFERPIHEQVNTSLERAGIQIADTEIVFDHSGYADSRVMPEKLARNRALIEAALARDPEGDPNLRYFFAAACQEAGEIERAAAEFERCALASEGRRRRLAVAARVKQAECLSRLGRAAEAVLLLVADPKSAEHPLALELRAAEAASRGDASAARRHREALLAAPDTAHLPAVALKPMKVRALQALAEDTFSSGRKEAAVRLLRLALSVARPEAGAGTEVAASYVSGCRGRAPHDSTALPRGISSIGATPLAR